MLDLNIKVIYTFEFVELRLFQNKMGATFEMYQKSFSATRTSLLLVEAKVARKGTINNSSKQTLLD